MAIQLWGWPYVVLASKDDDKRVDKLDGTPHYHKDEDLELRTRQGVKQQLRGTNFTQFWPPTPLEWTVFTYRLPFHLTKSGLSTDHLPTSSCPRSYWMTPQDKIFGLFLTLVGEVGLGFIFWSEKQQNSSGHFQMIWWTAGQFLFQPLATAKQLP